MIITIHYQADISEPGNYVGTIVTQRCQIQHQIDTETMQTISLNWQPIEEEEK